MIIPGQSLTAEPKNAPYENPPEINTEEGAVMWHLERLLEDDRLESLSDTLELGVDVVSLTEGLLRGAVLDGIHSIDISLVIAPVIHEFIASTAVKLGLDFEEGLPDDSKERTNIKYQINSRKARKMLDELDLEGDTDDVVEEENTQEELPMDMPKVSIGLMARPVGEML
mgnify:FL=1|jgi:hypothetical protein|tara:strand:+ start:459 stop:968 length:510 start_codon:yes stop_codon:yes gene_type:complete